MQASEHKAMEVSHASHFQSQAGDTVASDKQAVSLPNNMTGFGEVRNTYKKKKKKHRRHRKKTQPAPLVLLRPAGSQVPRAPENSTQFIMDDHENSNMFYNFDSAKESAEGEVEFSNQRNVTEFALYDFDLAYRSANEERLMNCSVDELKRHIMKFENKKAKLQHQLKSLPSVLLHDLQDVLIDLQQENKRLKQEYMELCRELRRGKPSSSSSSSMSTSDSDSETDHEMNVEVPVEETYAEPTQSQVADS